MNHPHAVLRLLAQTLGVEAAWVVATVNGHAAVHSRLGWTAVCAPADLARGSLAAATTAGKVDEPGEDTDAGLDAPPQPAYLAWLDDALHDHNGAALWPVLWPRRSSIWPAAVAQQFPRASVYAQHEITTPQGRRLGFVCVAGLGEELPPIWRVQMAACAALLAHDLLPLALPRGPAPGEDDAQLSRPPMVLEQSPMGMGITDGDGRPIYLNPALRRWLRLPAHGPLACDWNAILHTDDRAARRGLVRQVLHDGLPRHARLRFVPPACGEPDTAGGRSGVNDDGDGVLWAEVHVTRFQGGVCPRTGSPLLLVTVLDISASQRAQQLLREAHVSLENRSQALREALKRLRAKALERGAEQKLIEKSKRLLQVVADTVPALLAYFDRDLRFVFANNAYGQWNGRRPQELKGALLLDVLDPVRRDIILPHVRLAVAGQAVDYELCLTPHGCSEPRWKAFSLIPDFDATGVVQGFVLLAVDIDERKKMALRLENEARRDPLTNLPNRRSLLESLDHALARAKRQRNVCALLFLDLNGFKNINDAHGHEVGDGVLKVFAQVLLSCVRETDTVARLAGDEFCVVLEGLRAQPEADIRHISGKIHDHLARVSRVAGRPVTLRSSVGVALFDPREPMPPLELISRADTAMYLCKREGKPSGLHFYAPGDGQNFVNSVPGVCYD